MHVLISGAGVAGPTLAWFLAKAGARVTVVEKSHALLPHGQNVDIQGSARAVIEKMGLMKEVRRWSTKEKGTRFVDAKGRPFAAFPLVEGSSASFTSELEILRGDLAAVLHAATKDHPNVEYRFGTTIESVVPNGEDFVGVVLDGGEVRRFDLLVAADGQWSKVRAQCFPPASIDVIDKGMYAVYWTIPRLPGDDDWWNVYLALRSRIITIRPDPHGTIRAMFTCVPRTEARKTAWREAAKGSRQTRAELLRREFSDAGWQAQRLLDSIDAAPDFYFQPIQQIKMDRWSSGRVVCLGDAAYAPSPLTGMGTSLAIDGAYVLAGELSKLAEGEHPARALDAFESAFRPFVEETQKVHFLLPGIAHPETTWSRALLEGFMRILARVVAMPCWANELDHGKAADFPLPRYASFG